MSPIIQNLQTIQNRISRACKKAERNEDRLRLLLATKTVAPEQIRIALAEGNTLIGENKVQELKEKYEALQSIPHETHFIGHLQSNKIRDVVRYADCIQSMDRLSLAQKLDKHLEREGKTIDVFIQVNTSGESSKFGVEPQDALSFVHTLRPFSHIKIRGLMTIGLFSRDIEAVRRCFQRLKQLQTQLLDQGIPVAELSMGMSNDLEIAIEEGATMVRIGTAVFGPRRYPDSYYWNEKNQK